jgi:hypothetical protein
MSGVSMSPSRGIGVFPEKGKKCQKIAGYPLLGALH